MSRFFRRRKFILLKQVRSFLAVSLVLKLSISVSYQLPLSVLAF